MTQKIWMPLALLVGLLASPAVAQSPDVAEGRALAVQACASCHQVLPDEERPVVTGKPPAFAVIARIPTTTELALKVFMRSSHSKMPNIMLSDRDIDVLAAYILSLPRQ